MPLVIPKTTKEQLRFLDKQHRSTVKDTKLHFYEKKTSSHEKPQPLTKMHLFEQKKRISDQIVVLPELKKKRYLKKKHRKIFRNQICGLNEVQNVHVRESYDIHHPLKFRESEIPGRSSHNLNSRQKKWQVSSLKGRITCLTRQKFQIRPTSNYGVGTNHSV